MVMAAVAAAAIVSPARADAVLDQIRAEARATPMTPFERTVRVEQGSRPPVVRVDRFNPAAPAGRQWTLVSVDGRAPTSDEVSEHARQVNAQPVPGFHRLPTLLQGPPTAIERQGPRTVYRWAALKKGAAPSGQGPDFSERLSAEATVLTGARPVLEQVRVFAAEGFGVMGVARINRFESLSRYTQGSRGHQLAGQNTEVDARIPFRASGATRTTATFRAL
jgi:hypothetical protein